MPQLNNFNYNHPAYRYLHNHIDSYAAHDDLHNLISYFNYWYRANSAEIRVLENYQTPPKEMSDRVVYWEKKILRAWEEIPDAVKVLYVSKN